MEHCFRNSRYRPETEIYSRDGLTVFIDKTQKYIIKLVDLRKRPDTIESLEIQKVASKANLAPQIVDSYICRDRNYMVSVEERLETTLDDFLDNVDISHKDATELILQIYNGVALLKQSNIIIDDLHLSNIMLDDKPNDLEVRLSSGVKYIYFIDYEVATLDEEISSETPSMRVIELEGMSARYLLDSIYAILTAARD